MVLGALTLRAKLVLMIVIWARVYNQYPLTVRRCETEVNDNDLSDGEQPMETGCAIEQKTIISQTRN